MYKGGVNSNGTINYNFLFCHACLSSNRTLTMVGDYFDIYMKICDNVRMNVTPQVSICWECMTLLKKIWAFKKKVENAQKILQYCVKMQAPLPSLSHLTQASTETTSFVPIDQDEYEYDLDKADNKMEDVKDELMIRIEDVRGQCEILDEKPVIDLSSNSIPDCDVTVHVEPLSPHDEEQKYQCWKRSINIVFKSICEHQYAHHFLRPVSDDLAPLYSRIVRRPTDLGTIRTRIRDGVIRTTGQLTRELLLMFSNALMYNSSHHEMYHMAVKLRAEALHKLSLLPEAPAAGAAPPRAPRAPRRRRAPPPRAPAAIKRRRATMWGGALDAHQLATQTTLKESKAKPDPPAATVRRRRASEWATPPRPRPASPPRLRPASPPRLRPASPPRPRPASPLSPAPPPRSSAPRVWNWTCLDLDLEHLVPRHCIKKYKTVLL